MTVLRFEIRGDMVHLGDMKRKRLLPGGCNEPFKDHYWCPRKAWFSRIPCPFTNRRECDNYKRLCGNL